MKCDDCGCTYKVSDAIEEFEEFFDGLSYSTEFDPYHYCADCAIERMKDIIRSQEGYDEAYGDEADMW